MIHMKRITLLLVIAIILIYQPAPLLSKKENTGVDKSRLTLDRIFKNKEFDAKRMGRVRWLEHGSGYTSLEKSEEKSGGNDIVRHFPGSGKTEIEVPASMFIPNGKKKPLKISGYQWSADGNWMLIFTNTKRVWRIHTRGDYWVLNLKSKALWKLGGKAPESSMMFTKFSPNSKQVAYVSKNNIYVQTLGQSEEEGKITQLTADGSKTIINGTSDWVYEEEFAVRDGFRWSPDSKHIAYWQFDASGVKDFYMINNTAGLYSKIIPIQYPKVGTTNSSCKIGVVPVTGGNTKWFKVPGDPRQHYIARMDWADSSKEVMFQRLNRLQNTKKVLLGNIKSGNVKTILTEKDKAWVEVDNNLKWLDKGKKFTWVSERDGWRHMYIVSRSGDKVKLITPGEYDVTRVLKIDKKKGWVYYMASPENPTQRFLFRTRLNGRGKAQRLTPKGMPGTHSYSISSDAKYALHTYSSFEQPTKTQLVRLPNHKTVRMMVDNKKLEAQIKELKRHPVEFFRVDIGNDVKLDGWCMKPPDFNQSKKYPVLFFVYGEPAGQTVLDRWGGNRYFWSLMLTQQGYIVMSIDNRGTPAPRGREWRKCIYRQIGILASKDQAAAAQAIIKNRPYVDAERIGIWGWSGGGSMTLNMMFRYPDIYRTGMSVAPVPNQRYYDTIYQERYMGLPKDNKEGFKNGSPITFAHQLKGNLLLVHGTGDDNVHYQGSEELINKLIEHNKHFTMMAYPNRSHGIYEGKGTTLHLYTLLTRYLKEHLPPNKSLNNKKF